MAVTVERTDERVTLATWDTLGEDQTGAAVAMAHLPSKTVQISGTLGGATVTLEGTMDIAGTWVALTDVSGAGLFVIQENPLFIRPVVAGGGGTTAVDVVLCASNLLGG